MAQELPERSDMEIAYWLLPTDWQSCRWGSTEHKIRAAVPGSYEIFILFFFALCPKSTWEQWKLFSTRFSGTAIMIIMISISIAIAAGLFSGQFGSPGEEGVAARSRHASLGQNWGREQKKKKILGTLSSIKREIRSVLPNFGLQERWNGCDEDADA